MFTSSIPHYTVPEGNTIELRFRRPGDGRREPCEHCALLFIELPLKIKPLPQNRAS